MKKNKGFRFLSVFLMFVMCFCLFTPAAVSAEEEENVVHIRGEADLRDFSKNCSLDTWSFDKTFVLDADIVLSEDMADYLPIPVFSGTFDGNGHTISVYTVTESVSRAGLFGTVTEKGTVKNVKVVGQIAPSGDADTIGGLVGINYGRLTDCAFEGTIQGNSTVGGIVGLNEKGGQIMGCSFSGTLTGEHYVGGIAGQNLGNILRCVNNGSINTTAVQIKTELSDIGFDNLLSTESLPAGTDIGGIAGFSKGRLEYCKNTGNVGYEHMGYNVGGIAGRHSGYMNACENSGTIKGRKDIGGIAGQLEPLVMLKYSEGILERISAEFTSLENKADRALSNAENITSQLSADMDRMLSGAEAVRNSVESLTDAASGWGDDSIDQINRTAENLSNAVKDMGPVLEDASKSIEDTKETIKDLSETEDGVTEKISGAVDAMESALGSMEDTVKQAGDIADSLAKSDRLSVTSVGRETEEERNSLEEASSAFHETATNLQGTLSASSDTLIGDLRSMSAQVREITDLMKEGAEEIEGKELSGFFDDVSEEERTEISDGVILRAKNSGNVEGDIDTGGIAGCLGVEYDFDPEDNLVKEGDRTLDFRYEVYAVVSGSINEGDISGKKDCVGGIAGYIALGCVRNCENYGTIGSESGDYAGGVAGKNDAVIKDCFVKCSLTGRRYVGGITGSGKEDNTVSGCYAMVEIPEAEEYAGAISGIETGDFFKNCFVSDSLGGLGRMSLGGKAEPVSYETLMTVEGIPDGMRQFTLRFMAEGEELKRESFSYGDSFGKEVFPEIPKKEGCYAVWDSEDVTSLHFDKTINAVYSRYIMTLPSDKTREDGQPVFMVDGHFDEDAQLSISTGTGEAPENTKEQWHLEFPADGSDSHTIRFLPEGGKTDKFAVYVKSGGVYQQAECTDFGKYLTFEAEGTSVDIVAASAYPAEYLWIAAGCAVILILVLILIIKKIKGHKKGKKGTDKETNLLEKTEETAESDKTEKAEETAEIEKEISAKETIETARAEIPEEIAETEKEISAKETIETASAEKPEETAKTDKGKKAGKKWVLPVILGIVLVCVIAGILFIGERLKNSVEAYQLLHDFSRQPEYALSISADIILDEEMDHTDLQIYKTEEEGKKIVCIENRGIPLYYADNAVILENGKAYGMNSLFPDYSELLYGAAELYQSVDYTTEKQDGITICSVEAEGENAKDFLKLFLPSVSEYLSDTQRMKISLQYGEGELKSLTFTSEGSLLDEDHVPYTLSAEMKPEEVTEEMEIPEAVQKTVISGELNEQKDITEDLFRLMSAWADFHHKESETARILLNGECGPISLKDEMKYEQTILEGQKIGCIRKNSRAVYFSDHAVCNKDGLGISAEESVMADSAELLDLLYQVCLNGEFDCMDTGNNSYLYTLSMEEGAMENFSETILPDIKNLPASFISGSVELTVEGNEITDIRVDCAGSVEILSEEAEVNVSAEMIFTRGEGFVIPDAVKDALLK